MTPIEPTLKSRSEAKPGDAVELPDVGDPAVISAQGTCVDENAIEVHLLRRGHDQLGWQDTLDKIGEAYFGEPCWFDGPSSGTVADKTQLGGKDVNDGPSVILRVGPKPEG